MEIWDAINRANILTAGVQEKFENATGVGTLFKEIVMEISPKLKQRTNTHVWKGLKDLQLDSSQPSSWQEIL